MYFEVDKIHSWTTRIRILDPEIVSDKTVQFSFQWPPIRVFTAQVGIVSFQPVCRLFRLQMHPTNCFQTFLSRFNPFEALWHQESMIWARNTIQRFWTSIWSETVMAKSDQNFEMLLLFRLFGTWSTTESTKHSSMGVAAPWWVVAHPVVLGL